MLNFYPGIRGKCITAAKGLKVFLNPSLAVAKRLFSTELFDSRERMFRFKWKKKIIIETVKVWPGFTKTTKRRRCY